MPDNTTRHCEIQLLQLGEGMLYQNDIIVKPVLLLLGIKFATVHKGCVITLYWNSHILSTFIRVPEIWISDVS